MSPLLYRLWREDRGASTVEFVMVLPILTLLLAGSVFACMMMYAASTLHFAVEDAARCGAVKTGICTSATTTQTYALSRYRGPKMNSLTFTATPASTCGYQVAGSGTFLLKTGLKTLSVPISASGCFPI